MTLPRVYQEKHLAVQFWAKNADPGTTRERKRPFLSIIVYDKAGAGDPFPK